ncbi:MAG: hypothetical protein GEU90_16375 [Gemmatimonas sp.]|nr:hypothetical protein [Gemmatimonas sp.]
MTNRPSSFLAVVRRLPTWWRLVAIRVVLLLASCTDATAPQTNPDECANDRGHQLGIGQVVAGSGDPRSLCIEVRQKGEYVLIPFVASPRDTLLQADIVLSGSGLGPVVPSSSRVASRADVQAGASDGLATEEDRAAFDAGLRDVEAELFRRLGGPGPHLRSQLAPASVTIPAEGSTVEINVASRCDATNIRHGRVAAVSQRAIVLADTGNPTVGFSELDYDGFARDFDDFVFPTLSEAFGSPTDIDENGRVILFFTRAVNELTPPGGTGVIAGYFWGGDVFPRHSDGGLGGCAASNEGEILYLAIPDPGEEIGSTPISAETLRRVALSTIGHELQHLINTGRRLHVNGASTVEEKWLNEGLSFMAEELLFYAASGLSAGQNLGVEEIRSTPQVQDAFVRFAESNLGRLNLYLQGTHFSSPMGSDLLPTRGAAWSFLRYVADRDGSPDENLLRALANSTDVGLANLQQVIGSDPLEWMRDWSIAIYTDDLVPPSDPRFDQPSWNHRQLIASLRVDGLYPLRTVALGDGESTLTLPAGGSVYAYFGAEAGSRIRVRAILVEPSADVDVWLSLVRIR